MNIIRAQFNHLEAVSSLLDGYRQFYRQSSNLDGARHFIGERLTKDDSVIFLALDDKEGDKESDKEDAALGFTQLYPSFSSVSMAPIWILNDLFVAASARGRGVGEALLLHAAAFGAQSGAVRLELGTEITNVTAQRLYERLGWQREEDFYHYGLPIDSAE